MITFGPNFGAVGAAATAVVPTAKAAATMALARKTLRNLRMLMSSSPQPTKSTPTASCRPPLPTSSQHHLCLQSEISRRAAGTQCVRPRNRDPLVACLVESRECSARQGQSHIGLASELSIDCTESGQDAERTAWVVARWLEVDLHDLPAGAPARVADRDHD